MTPAEQPFKDKKLIDIEQGKNMENYNSIVKSAMERLKLKDRAGSYHVTWVGRLRSWYKLRSKNIKHGKGIIIRPRVDIVLTDNALLEIGNYCVIDSYSYILLTKPEPHVIFEDFVGIGRGTIIACKKLVKIGAYTQIGPFCQFNDQDHSYGRDTLIMNQPAVIKPIIVGKDCWFGSGCRVLKGVTIGDGSVIGAGSVVTTDIPSYEIWAGVPARFIKKRV